MNLCSITSILYEFEKTINPDAFNLIYYKLPKISLKKVLDLAVSSF